MGSNGQVTRNGEVIDWRQPWEPIDGLCYDETALHSARRDAVALINDAFAALESVLSRKDVTLCDVRVRFYGIAGALGLNVVDGRSFTEIADQLGCARATLSKIAVEFCQSHDLQGSFAMKRDDTRQSYQRARIASITASSNGNGSSCNGTPRQRVFPAVPTRHRSV